MSQSRPVPLVWRSPLGAALACSHTATALTAPQNRHVLAALQREDEACRAMVERLNARLTVPGAAADPPSAGASPQPRGETGVAVREAPNLSLRRPSPVADGPAGPPNLPIRPPQAPPEEGEEARGIVRTERDRVDAPSQGEYGSGPDSPVSFNGWCRGP